MTNKLKYFFGNWKMYGDLSSIKILKTIDSFLKKNKKLNKIKIVICIPSTLIHIFSSKLKKSPISIGAQNCHFIEDTGPYTGSISASMIKKNGANYVIIGHSENRKENETNWLIKKKLISALNQNLKIIFCIGESLKDKRRNRTFGVLKKQMNESLDSEFDFNKIILAYEPVWSIGSGKIPKIYETKKIVRFIKQYVRKKFRHSNFPRVLYGGSVNAKNVGFFAKISELDGFLIGGASKSSKKFIDIIKNYYK